MLGPSRLYLSLRQNADAGLVAAIAAVSAFFAATPFLIPVIAEEYDVSLGLSGLVSTAQVGAFALVVFIAGRTLATSRRYLIGASAVSVAANLLSLTAPTYGILLALRVVAGGAGGVLVWLSWAKAMRLSGSMRNVAAAGPFTVFVATPLIGWLADRFGTDAVFALLALVAMPAIVLPAEFAGYRHERRRMSPSRSNVVLVVAMGVMTMAGSSLFVYGATVGRTIGIDPFVVSLAFSGNALAGFVAARRTPRRPVALWPIVIAVCAIAVGVSERSLLFVPALVLWGYAFWMATPAILASIAAWSLAPEERVGDTQSAMAAGRAIGPAVGAALVGDGRFDRITLFAVVGLVGGAVALAGVDRYRRSAKPPEGSLAAGAGER